MIIFVIKIMIMIWKHCMISLTNSFLKVIKLRIWSFISILLSNFNVTLVAFQFSLFCILLFLKCTMMFRFHGSENVICTFLPWVFWHIHRINDFKQCIKKAQMNGHSKSHHHSHVTAVNRFSQFFLFFIRSLVHKG